MIGTYHYTSDYGTGRLMIEATEDGIDISDYESEDTYRFLANETNVKNEEENKVYLEYPAQVYEDDTVIFEYYILGKSLVMELMCIIVHLLLMKLNFCTTLSGKTKRGLRDII